MLYPIRGLVGFNPVVYNKEGHHLLYLVGEYLIIIHKRPVEIVGYTLKRPPGEEIPLFCQIMILDNISYNSGILMIFPRKVYLTPVNHRMAVGEHVYMPVKNNALPYQFGIVEIIFPLNIITNVIPDDYLIGIPRQVYVGKDIHTVL